MIALSLIKNKELKIIEKKIETKLHPLSCRIEILYSGICASDIPRAFDSMAYSYPLIMGHEFVGRIIQVGKSVNRLSVDDIVSAYPLIPEHIHNPKKKNVFIVKMKIIIFATTIHITDHEQTVLFVRF